MNETIRDLVTGMERATLEWVARRWCAVALALGWRWSKTEDGSTVLEIEAWVDRQLSLISVICADQPGWYEAFHDLGEPLASGPVGDVIAALTFWVEHQPSQDAR